MRAGDKRSKISEKVPAARRALAEAMNELYEHVKQWSDTVTSQITLTDAIALAEAGYPGADEKNLCKYLAGKHVPPEEYLLVFHRVISAQTSGQQMPFTWEQLLQLHGEAAATDRRRRAVRQQERESTMRELGDTKRELEQVRQELAEVSALKSAASSLPVPPAEGDRQASDFAHEQPPAAAAELIRLSNGGRHEQALTMLAQFPAHFTAEDVASCIALFRTEGQHELADTLIQICGREDSHSAALVTMSRVLRRRNFHQDAETLLDMVV